MKEQAAAAAAALFRRVRVASIATVDQGAPQVSLAPYAVLHEPLAFLVLVSGLAAHTKHMQADPRVGLLVAEPERDDASVRALARVILQGEATPLRPDAPAYGPARSAYASRFAAMSGLFELGDFVLFAIRPTSVRVVTGFAQAASVSPESLAAAVAASA
jgi:heme iron utilization protein